MNIEFFILIFCLKFLLNDAFMVHFGDLNPCKKDYFYNSDRMGCVYDPLSSHQNCDTLEDKCPQGQFCSPFFMKCIASLEENAECPDYFPLEKIILCNKIQNLYCFNNRCQRPLPQDYCSWTKCNRTEICNPLRGTCERKINIFHCDPNRDLCYLNSDSFCHSRMKICVSYLLEGSFCDRSNDFCNKNSGLTCSTKRICEKII